MISADRPAFLAYDVVLALHIASGFIGMYGGLIPIFSVKGGRDHRQWGLLFTRAMAIAALTAFPLAWWRQDLFQGAVGLFSGYLALFGFRVLRRHNGKTTSGGGIVVDWILATVSLSAFLLLLALGVHFARIGSPDNQATGRAAVIFGLMGVIVAARDVQSLIVGGNSPTRRILDHLIASSLSLISAYSAFLNTQFHRLTRLDWPIDQKMLLPIAVGLPFLSYSVFIWRRQYQEQELQQNMSNQKSPNLPWPSELKRLQFFALTEGISFLLLLFIAVPLKRIGGDDSLVRLLGPIHGGLFIMYVLSVLMAIPTLKWGPARIGLALGASVLPFGTFLIDAQMRRERNSNRVA